MNTQQPPLEDAGSKIIEFLRKTGKPTHSNEICGVVEMDTITFDKNIKRLSAKGVVKLNQELSLLGNGSFWELSPDIEHCHD